MIRFLAIAARSMASRNPHLAAGVVRLTCVETTRRVGERGRR